jgi:hypothetical protein
VGVGDDALAGFGELIGHDAGDVGGQLAAVAERSDGCEGAVSGKRD